ncbi:MAG: hypothetical protein WC485_00180 [Opitutaceae bacterium]
MIFGLFDWLIVAGLLLVALWGLWALIRWVWPAATDNQAGKTVGTVVDVTQQWTVKAALYALREYDPIEADPKAIEAWNYLWTVAVKGKAPSVATPAPATAVTLPGVTPPIVITSVNTPQPVGQESPGLIPAVPPAADEHAESLTFDPVTGKAT